MLNTKKITTSSLRLVRIMSHLSNSENSVPWKEIRIPVPWGHIAAKECGTAGKQSVLGIHGWQDNCGTFDKLAPLLRLSDIHLVVVDLPGHGFSSHKPPGMLYHVFDWVVDIHRVISYLQWKEFSIIAHSMGAGIATFYSAIYSSNVKKLVSLDSIRPSIYPIDTLTERIKKGIDQLFVYEDRVTRPSPSFTEEEAAEMIKSSMFGSCDLESAKILLKRGAKVGDDGRLIFNRDPRLKINSIPGLTDEQMKVVAENVRCEYLLINAKDGLLAVFKTFHNTEETLERYKKGAKSFEVVEVEGTHHVHLNNPERVAPHINRFLSADIDCAIP